MVFPGAAFDIDIQTHTGVEETKLELGFTMEASDSNWREKLAQHHGSLTLNIDARRLTL